MNEEIPNVLIVDDEIDICFVLSGMLKSKNVESRFANSLAEAELLIENKNPSIIILDNHLPDGLGMEFMDHIKQDYPHIKIVMITAHDTQTDKTLAFKKGADYFIGKPFSISTVRKTIDSLLDRA